MWRSVTAFVRALVFLLPVLILAPAQAAAPVTQNLVVGRAVMIELPQPAATLFVADPTVASYQVPKSNRVLVFGKRSGTTSLFALNAAGKTIYAAEVRVSNDLSPMQEALAREFPALKLQLTAVPNAVLVSGEVPSAQVAAQVVALLDAFVVNEERKGPAPQSGSSQGQAQGQQGDDKGGAGGSATVGARHGRVINRLSVAGSNQVTIRVRIAEVSRTASERLGLKWNRAFSVNGNSYPLAKSPISLGAAAESLVGKDVTGILDALAEENLVSILAEPNLSVVSGETASFLAGGQLPFPVLKDEDMGIEFKDYGVLLDITPTILSDRRISMRVRPEVSEPDYASGIEMKGFILPGLRIRRAETTVELASGQSFALAGLMNNDLSQKVAKFPGLGDLPIIGALARSKSFERGESELVIIATAYLSQPSSAPLAIPNETLRSGTPLERHLFDAAPDVAPRTQGDVHVEQ